MEVKPIKTDADYRASLQEIETLMAARPDTPEGERLDVLATLVEAYERKHYPLDLPDPVLNRKRSLTLRMIWRLHGQLGIPAESLIKQTPPAA